MSKRPDPSPVAVPAEAAEVLRALLTLEPAAVRKVRSSVRRRKRPRSQVGPTADHGQR
jgi:hypothetical protein